MRQGVVVEEDEDVFTGACSSLVAVLGKRSPGDHMTIGAESDEQVVEVRGLMDRRDDDAVVHNCTVPSP